MSEGFEYHLSQVRHGLGDPRHVAMVKLTWSAGSWEPGRTRLTALIEERMRSAGAGHP